MLPAISLTIDLLCRILGGAPTAETYWSSFLSLSISSYWRTLQILRIVKALQRSKVLKPLNLLKPLNAAALSALEDAGKPVELVNKATESVAYS